MIQPKHKHLLSLLLSLQALFVGVFLHFGLGFAQTSQTAIKFIEVEGAQRIEPATIISYMPLRVGQVATDEAIDQSLKALFNSGLFADVAIRRKGRGLVVRVLENPIINQIIFEGNKRVKTETLLAESSLSPREVYTRAKVQDNVEKFIEIYRRTGRFSARIEPKLIQLSQNRVDIIYEIKEGEVTKVRSINFVGNKVFGDRRLRNEVSTRESRWWRFLTSADSYDPDRMAYDRELLRRHYLSRGYADFRVVSSLAELTKDGKEFFLTYNLEEGEVFYFGAAEVKSDVKDLDNEKLQELVKHKEGQRYDLLDVDETINAMTKELGILGYAFAQVRPQVRREPDKRIIHIEYVITQGARVYVERINIKNNVRTKDYVIRRELLLDEGDAYNAILAARGERNLRALGYFSRVQPTVNPASKPDRVILDIDVEEQSTGSLTFGLGYSSVDNLSFNFSISERNLLGNGHKIVLAANVSDLSNTLNVRFVEPYLFGRDLEGSIQLWRSSTEYKYSTFETEAYGLGFGIGFGVSENARFNIFTRFVNDNLLGSSNTAESSDYDDFKNLLGYSYFLDRRDDARDPTKGWDFYFSQLMDTPLGDARFVRTNAIADFYHTLFGDWVFHARLDGGYVASYGDEVLRYNDHFFKGASSFRGFRYAGVGSRDIRGGREVSYGATQYAIGTTEVQVPMGIPKEYGIRTFLFSDFGFVGGTEISYEPTFRKPDGYDAQEAAREYRRTHAAVVKDLPEKTFVFTLGDFTSSNDSRFEGQANFPFINAKRHDARADIPEILEEDRGSCSPFSINRIPEPIEPDEDDLSDLTDEEKQELVDQYATQKARYDSWAEARGMLTDEENGLLRTRADIIDCEYYKTVVDARINNRFVKDDFGFRMSVGLSLKWESPFGPVQFDFSTIIQDKVYDRSEGFRFSVGTTF